MRVEVFTAMKIYTFFRHFKVECRAVLMCVWCAGESLTASENKHFLQNSLQWKACSEEWEHVFYEYSVGFSLPELETLLFVSELPRTLLVEVWMFSFKMWFKFVPFHSAYI